MAFYFAIFLKFGPEHKLFKDLTGKMEKSKAIYITLTFISRIIIAILLSSTTNFFYQPVIILTLMIIISFF